MLELIARHIDKEFATWGRGLLSIRRRPCLPGRARPTSLDDPHARHGKRVERDGRARLAMTSRRMAIFCFPEIHVMTDLDALRGALITEVARWGADEWEMFAGPGRTEPTSRPVLSRWAVFSGLIHRWPGLWTWKLATVAGEDVGACRRSTPTTWLEWRTFWSCTLSRAIRGVQWSVSTDATATDCEARVPVRAEPGNPAVRLRVRAQRHRQRVHVHRPAPFVQD